MVFTSGKSLLEKVPPIKLDGILLNRVYQFKYLGHIITTDLKDDNDIEKERRAHRVGGTCCLLVVVMKVRSIYLNHNCQCFYTSNFNKKRLAPCVSNTTVPLEHYWACRDSVVHLGCLRR